METICGWRTLLRTRFVCDSSVSVGRKEKISLVFRDEFDDEEEAKSLSEEIVDQHALLGF